MLPVLISFFAAQPAWGSGTMPQANGSRSSQVDAPSARTGVTGRLNTRISNRVSGRLNTRVMRSSTPRTDIVDAYRVRPDDRTRQAVSAPTPLPPAD
jgi:hypothetical protein